MPKLGGSWALRPSWGWPSAGRSLRQRFLFGFSEDAMSIGGGFNDELGRMAARGCGPLLGCGALLLVAVLGFVVIGGFWGANSGTKTPDPKTPDPKLVANPPNFGPD